jgi:hypothetical protein
MTFDSTTDALLKGCGEKLLIACGFAQSIECGGNHPLTRKPVFCKRCEGAIGQKAASAKESLQQIINIISQCSETPIIEANNGRAIRLLTFWKQDLTRSIEKLEGTIFHSPQLKTVEMPSRFDAKREESVLQTPGDLHTDSVVDTQSSRNMTEIANGSVATAALKLGSGNADPNTIPSCKGN